MATTGLLSRYLSAPLPYFQPPYDRKFNVLSGSLNKTYPSLLKNKIDGLLVSAGPLLFSLVGFKG